MSLVLCLRGCYTYKPLPTVQNDFEVGLKYEIGIGNRPMERVRISAVTDSTLVVRKGSPEVIIQRDLITKSKFEKISPGKTVLGVVVAGFLTYALAGILS